MIRSLLATLAVILAMTWTAPSRAQGIDMSHGGPVDVTASNGLEYDQNALTVTARGDARAVRGDVTVTADQLVAYLRKKAAAPDAKPAAPPTGPAGADTGSNEIYRLEALGNVHIQTPTDRVEGADRGIYDIDQAVLVLTGPHLTLTTPQQVMTARDTMEYWSNRHMAVGRGNASVTTNDGRRITADTLVGYTAEAPAAPAGRPKPVQPASTGKAPGTDPLGASGKLQRVEAFGHAVVRTATETVTGDRGVYVPDAGIARLLGNVHITRGQNQLNGSEAVVNLKTGISTLSQAPGARVQGLVVPNDPAGQGTGNGKAAKP